MYTINMKCFTAKNDQTLRKKDLFQTNNVVLDGIHWLLSEKKAFEATQTWIQSPGTGGHKYAVSRTQKSLKYGISSQ